MYSWVSGWVASPRLSLEDCLAAFFAADELKGDDMYSCDKCKKLRNGAKVCQLLDLPEVLCIHLKRFKHEFTYLSKISTHVSFPLGPLDLKSFVHSDCRSTVTTYELFAVICHHGSAGGGHYTAYCLNDEDHNWYEMDDAYITRVDLTVVEDAEAYVLFYRKSQDLASEVRERALQIVNQSVANPHLAVGIDLMKFYVNRSWMNRFNTFAEPGPMSSFDFLCRHGGVSPAKVEYLEDLYVELQHPLWQYLNGRFGSIGHKCSHLVHCSVCQREHQRLERRRITEKELYLKLKEDAKRMCTLQRVCALSLRWFKEWEAFILGNEYYPPGPIDNTNILIKKNDQILLRPGSAYITLIQDQWQFFYQKYGGGPEVVYSLMNPQNVVVNLKPLHVAQQQDEDGCSSGIVSSTASMSDSMSAKECSSPSVCSVGSGTGSVSSKRPRECSSNGDGDYCYTRNIEAKPEPDEDGAQNPNFSIPYGKFGFLVQRKVSDGCNSNENDRSAQQADSTGSSNFDCQMVLGDSSEVPESCKLLVV